jgi:transposase
MHMTNTDPQNLIANPTPPPEPADLPDQGLPPRRKRGRKPVEILDETRQQILHLHDFYSARQISPRVGLSRKLVGRVLMEHGLPSCPQRPQHPQQLIPDSSKLDPFRELVAQRVRKRLTTTRILRELRQVGYQGGRTILGDYVRELRTQLTLEPNRSVKRRFETDPAEEIQLDWSPYEVPIGGRGVKIHVLGCLLAWSRKLYAYAFRDERQPTLLEGLACAFAYFNGVAARTVLDNMSTAVLGRISSDGKVLWHSRFLDFTRHYGTVPFACKVRDPDRKGKKEKSFRLLEDDFIRGSEFSCLDELNEQLRIWLDNTPDCGNLRVHGTTRRVPNEAFEHEQPLLIRLPEQRFAVHEQSVRVVDRDSTLSIRGTPYTVPAALANRTVAVRLFAEHFEVLEPHGRVAFNRRYVADEDKGRLVIDKTHYANLPRRPHSNGEGQRLDEAFLRRFPDLQPMVDGLKRRMKSLAPIHLRTLLRLCDRFGQEAFLTAARRAQDFRRFDALAVERILERAHPSTATQVAAADPIAPLSGLGPTALGELDPGSLDSFAPLDAARTTTDTSDPTKDPHGS